MTIPGIGQITLIALIAEIEDFNMFDTPGEFCSYLGIISWNHSSGDLTAAAAVSYSVLSSLLSNAKVKYATNDQAGSLKKIYAQLWIDQYRQPWDAWTLQGRTGNKTPTSSTNTNYYSVNFAGKVRFVYPDDEQSYNTVNWRAATNGSDLNTNPIWIMP